MRFWLFTCFVIFVLVQLYQWIKGFILPFPIYILGGAFLALVSNYDKGVSLLLKQDNNNSQETLAQTATLVDTGNNFPPDSNQLPSLESDSEKNNHKKSEKR